MNNKHLMELSTKQLSFIFDVIEEYEGYGDYMTTNGHIITGDEVDEVISMIAEELK